MKKISIHSIWLFLFVFSFFYELPLINLSFDRISPRLQDVAFVLGLFLYGGKLSSNCNNPIYKQWKHIVFWFFFCALFSGFFLLSGQNSLFSLLAAFRYIEGLILIKIILSIRVDKQIVLNAAFWGLLLDSVYCIYQLSHPREVMRASGVVTIEALTGPLSSSYFEIAQLLPLAAVLQFALLSQVEMPKVKKRIMTAIVVTNCWPLLYTGSRTGLLLGLISILMYFVMKKSKNIIALTIFLFGAVLIVNSINWGNTEFYTVSRAVGLEEEEHDSFDDRLQVVKEFRISEYDNSSFLPLVGGGFNVAPIHGHPRVDFGVHSMYLYPIEQAGFIGLALFIVFLLVSFKNLYKLRDYDFARAALSYLIAVLIVGIGAHNFWREFSSGNVNTFIIILFCLAYKFSNEENQSIAHQ